MAKKKSELILRLDFILLLLWGGALVYLYYFKSDFPLARKDFLYFSGYCLFFGLCGALWASSARTGARVAALLCNLLFALVLASLYLAVMYYVGIGNLDLTYDVFAVLQSDFAESVEFFLSFIYTPARLAVAVAVFVLALAVIYGNAGYFRRVFRRNERSKKVLLAGFLSLALGIFLFSQVGTVKYTTELYVRYYKSLYLFNRLHGQLAEREPVPAVKEQRGELYVLVIGESETRDLMGCYGGPAGNTPWMGTLRGQPGFAVFDNAYAAHVLTMHVLRLALSEGSSRGGDTFSAGGSNIISIARDAGMKTIWLSNQMDLGKRDNDVSALAQTADIHFFTEKNERAGSRWSKPDEILLPVIEKTLAEVDFSGNTLLVVHLMGNHYNYKDRYPAEFKPELTPQPQNGSRAAKAQAALGEDPKAAQLLDEYLVSVAYIDRLLAEIQGLAARYAERPVAMVYFADHGEELYDRRGGGHNPATFTWGMSRIPMFTWLSEGYRARYPERQAQLEANAAKVFTNDYIYTLFLGLAHIDTAGYQPEFDPGSAAYSLAPEEAVIFNGRKVTDDPELAGVTR